MRRNSLVAFSLEEHKAVKAWRDKILPAVDKRETDKAIKALAALYGSLDAASEAIALEAGYVISNMADGYRPVEHSSAVARVERAGEALLSLCSNAKTSKPAADLKEALKHLRGFVKICERQLDAVRKMEELMVRVEERQEKARLAER